MQGRSERREMREETKNTKGRVGRAGQQGAADAGGNEATGQDGWMDGTRGKGTIQEKRMKSSSALLLSSMPMDGWIMDHRTHTHAESERERDERRQGQRQQQGWRRREGAVCVCSEFFIFQLFF